MAQTGYTPISIYYSATASNTPTAGNLVAGELAINTADGKLFYKDSAGVVQVIGTKGGVGSSSTTQVLYNSSGLVVGSANMTFNGTSLTLAKDASINGVVVGQGYTSGFDNTAVGTGALQATTGYQNSAFGKNALIQNGAGYVNTALGFSTLYSNTTGNNNTAVGNSALFSNTTASYSTAVGYQALYNNTATQNTAIGYTAGFANTTGTNNNTFGNAAGGTITTGSNNLALGSSSAGSLTTGSNNIYVGYSFASSASVVGEVVMAFGGTGKGGGTAYIQGPAYQTNNSAAWSITSDQRLKKNIVDNTVGLSAINAIQVRNFEYRTADEVTDLPKESAIDIKGVQLGAIAQELKEILPDCVKTESTGVMSVDTTNLTWYLINAVKELNAKITALENK